MTDAPVPLSISRYASLIRRKSHGWFAVGLGVLLVNILIFAWSLKEIDAADYWVSHTYQVISQTQGLVVNLRNAAAATRGYDLLPDDANRSAFQAASRDAESGLATLVTLTTDNATQQKRVAILKPLVAERIDELNKVLAVRDASGPAAAEELRQQNQALQLSNQIGTIAASIEDDEKRLLEIRNRYRRVRRLEVIGGEIVTSGLIIIALLIGPLQVNSAVSRLTKADFDLRESELLSESLFEGGAQPILVLNPEGVMVRANHQAAALFALTASEMHGRAISSLIAEKYRLDFASHHADSAIPGTSTAVRRFESRLRRADDTEFYAEIILGPVEAAHGPVTVAFISDITDRRAAEQAIRDQAEELRVLTARLFTVQEDERRSIARDLHDDLAQTLAFLSMDISRLAAAPANPSMGTQLSVLKQKTVDAAQRIRNLSHQIHPSALDDLGLEGALEEFCAEFELRTSIQTRFVGEDVTESLPRALTAGVYYVVAECLRNVATHSGASQASVTLQQAGKALHVAIADNGCGISSKAVKNRSGIGFTSMRERIRNLGGTFEVSDAVPHGVMVRATLPVLPPESTN